MGSSFIGWAKPYARAPSPEAWLDFCRRYVGECKDEVTTPVRIQLTPEVMQTLVAVNNWVNHSIAPMTDRQHWGVDEKWDYPDDLLGDCEDYVLQKRRKLRQLGFVEETLLITLVKTKDGEGHAVLTVPTTIGDFVLDSLTDTIFGWRMTGYTFTMRQDQTNLSLWVALEGPVPATAKIPTK